MNIHSLRDEDNDAGFYAAVCGITPSTWKGCKIYVSEDGGTTWTSVQTISTQATMGYATDALGNFLGGNIPDELNTLTVSMRNGTLSATDNAGLLAGTNAAIYGDEIVFFRDATLVSAGTYRVRGFLRGRRGSEYAMGSHVAGERFILLSESTIVRIVRPTSDIGPAKSYKAVSVGSSEASAAAYSFANQGRGLMPYAPVQLGGGRDASGNLTLQWIRRNRLDAEWRDSVDVPMSEASEAYEVEIYSSSAFTTVKRTITGITSPTASYSAAQQSADFGSPQSTVYFRVYQMSAVVGRGEPASGRV